MLLVYHVDNTVVRAYDSFNVILEMRFDQPMYCVRDTCLARLRCSPPSEPSCTAVSDIYQPLQNTLKQRRLGNQTEIYQR